MTRRNRQPSRRIARGTPEPLERRALCSVTFGSLADYGAGSSLGAVLVDLNGDGKLDVVSPNSSGDGVTVYLNNGDGTLGPGTNYPTSSSSANDGGQPYALAVGDFNGDGHPDLAVASFGGDLVILDGNGSGGFGAPTVYAGGSGGDGVAVGDFNGDGKPDVAMTTRYDDTLHVYTNNGDGTFAAPVNYTTGQYPQTIGVADLNGDGKADLVTACYGDSTLSVFINQGGGTFNPAVNISNPGLCASVAVADVNGDGRPDLISDGPAAGGGSGEVSVLLNSGDGTTYGTPIDTPLPAGSNPEIAAVADFDGDGKADLLVGSYGSDQAFATLINGSTTTTTPTPTPTPTPTTTALAPTVDKSTLPGSVVAGAKVKPGVVTVTVTNDTAGVLTGADTVDLYATTTGAVDSASVLLGTVRKSLKVAVGRSATVAVPVKTLPMTAGTYTVLPVATDAAGVATAAATGPTLTVGPATVTLAAGVGAVTPTAVSAGKSVTVAVTLTNAGNVDAAGTASITVGLSTDGRTVAVPFAAVTKRLTVKAGGRPVVLHVKVKVPAAVAAGTYTPAVTIAVDGHTATAFGATPITAVGG